MGCRRDPGWAEASEGHPLLKSHQRTLVESGTGRHCPQTSAQTYGLRKQGNRGQAWVLEASFHLARPPKVITHVVLIN